MIDELAIGQRIAYYRGRRRLTQEELAGLVGISTSMVKKIESGERLVTRFSQLLRFAEVLRVRDLRELTGVPLPLAPDGRRGHAAAGVVRQALLDRTTSTGDPPDLDHLSTQVEQTWQTWQEPSPFRYDAVGQQLPTLIDRVSKASRSASAAQRLTTLHGAAQPATARAGREGNADRTTATSTGSGTGSSFGQPRRRSSGCTADGGATMVMRWPWSQPEPARETNHVERIPDGDRVLGPGQPSWADLLAGWDDRARRGHPAAAASRTADDPAGQVARPDWRTP